MIETEIRSKFGFTDIVGRSNSLRRVLDDIAMVEPADSTVLIPDLKTIFRRKHRREKSSSTEPRAQKSTPFDRKKANRTHL
jgi:hypothetical protein